MKGRVIYQLLHIIEESIEDNVDDEDRINNIFQSIEIPNISLPKYTVYIMRLINQYHYEKQDTYKIVMVAVAIMRRLEQKTGLVITPSNVHRLILTSMMVAIKLLIDSPISLKRFAIFGGTSANDLNACEGELLRLLDWDIHINSDTIDELIIIGSP